VQAVCSGFVYAVTTADAYIRGGLGKRVLVIGAETFSRILDWTDRTTCVLFGDGAGAIVLEPIEARAQLRPIAASSTQPALRRRHRDKLYVDGGPSTTGTVGHLRMEGREVFKHAVGMITDVVDLRLRCHRYHGGGHRLVRAAPGQQAHHRWFGQKAWHRRKGRRHRRSARQHLRGLGPARAGHCGK
jgi:3-oxoacyl-[acyl-carrier-protein] synthase III